MHLFRLICLFVSSVALSNGHAVEQISFGVEQTEFSGWTIDNIQLVLELPTEESLDLVAAIPQLSIKVDKLKSTDKGTFKHLKVSCPAPSLQQTLQFNLIECQSGTFAVTHAQFGNLEGKIDFFLDIDNEQFNASIAQLKLAQGVVNLKANSTNGKWNLELKGRSLAVASLKKLVSSFVSLPLITSDESGHINLQISANGRDQNLHSAKIGVKTFDVGFDGNSVAEDLDAELNLSLKNKNGEWFIEEQLSLISGAIYIEPGIEIGEVVPGLLLEPADEAITLSSDVSWRDEQLQIQNMFYEHPNIISIKLDGSVQPKADSPIERLSVALKTSSLAAVFPVYLQPLLFGSGLDEVELVGKMALNLKLNDGSISDFHLMLDDVYAEDQVGRFHVAGLNGDIRLNSDPSVKGSKMTWRGGSIYQVNIGASEMKLSSQGRSMQLSSAMRIPIFDGELKVNDLVMKDLGLEDYSVRIESTLTPITLSEFTEAMGWPIMAGHISGEIPGVVYKQGSLTTEGQLLVNVFDGDITISQLWIEDLFGLIPTLFADIAINDIDLGILTKTFEFGDITGRLGGYMNGLRLDNWEPVKFDAKLATPDGDRSRHRISQRAINNITSIGGGGGTDAISRGIMGVFEDFPYSKIGLSCKLVDGICFMDGVEKVEEGYYIVKRGLLPPWLNIKGYNEKVDWPELLERLQNISKTDGPTIE